MSEGNPFDWRNCIQTLFPIKGRQTPVNPNQTIEYTVPDMSSRPWAAIWEKYFEQGMKRPAGAEEAILSNF